MAGRTPAEAVANFVTPLQRAISCVTPDVLDVSGGYHPSEVPHALTLGPDQPTRLRGAPSELALSVTMLYHIVKASGARGPWKVSTFAYLYVIEDGEGREVFSYHWHPHLRGRMKRPHLHLGAGAMVGRAGLADAHLPTERVALEAIIGCAISELGVEPLRSDWRDVLDSTEAAFDAWRTWPRSGTTSPGAH